MEPYADFVIALSELKNPIRNKTVRVRAEKGEYTFEYADLATITEEIREVFGRHRLALLQPVESDGTTLTVTTRILHSSGTIVAQTTMQARAPAEPKALGSLITYLRRYAVSALVGITADDDDDGSAAQNEPALLSNRLKPSKLKLPAPSIPQVGKVGPIDLIQWEAECLAQDLPIEVVARFIETKTGKRPEALDDATRGKMIRRLRDEAVKADIRKMNMPNSEKPDDVPEQTNVVS